MLANYDLEELIGCGTFGNVYLVRCKLSENPYVLKEVRISNMSPAERQQALTEVAVLKRCRHKNIIRYKEAAVVMERGVLSIVMEYAECGDMYAAIKRQQGVYFKECEILSWFIQITLALQYIHSRNILHRDLKTQNLFLTASRLIKVGDFGIARVLKEDKELATTAIGTPYYLSPEICQRKPYNCKSDIWALGCVLFEIAALIHPFQGQNFHQLVCAILKVQHKELPSHTGPLIRDLISNLLASDPVKRPSADEILSIPSLQSHLYRYIDMHTSPLKQIEIQDSFVKHNGSRRFSADDVLEVSSLTTNQSPPSTGRRCPSVSLPPKGNHKMKNNIANDTNISLHSNSKPCKQKQNISIFHKTPKSESRQIKRRASSPQIEDSSMSKKAGISNKSVGSKNPILRTYTLFKKAVGKSEINANSRTNKSPSRRKSISSMSSDKEYKDVSHHIIMSSHEKQLSEGAANISTDYLESLEIQQDVEKSQIDDVFIAPGRTTEISNDIVSPTITTTSANSDFYSQCHHLSSCFHCILDILWKNRITSSKIINETERNKLKNHLIKVFGMEEFDNIYQTMANGWDSYSEETESISSMLKMLRIDQQQFIPLFMQLIQLDIVSQQSPVTF